MKIGYIALYVQDLENAAAFFETYFDGRRNKRYHNDKTGFSVKSGPRTTGDGCYKSCIVGPEGCLIEITV